MPRLHTIGWVDALEPRRLLAALPVPSHVVVVIEENHSYQEIIGNTAAPYVNSLAGKGALFTQSFAVSHPSQPNYLALFSGSTQGVSDDNGPLSYKGPDLGSLLQSAGRTFAGYSEDLPATGSTVLESGGYARKHNPWSDFADVPSSENLPFSSFPQNFNSLPTVSFVVPNLNNDMHDGTVAVADGWLQANLGGYATWAQTHNSLLIVTWDEDDRSQSNRIPTIFVGQGVKPGAYGEPITHYSVLRTIEDMYRLPYLGFSATAAAIQDVWQSSVITAASGQTLWTVEGTAVSGVVATFKDTNPLAPASVTASINWGDGSSGIGTVAFNAATGNLQVSASHVYKSAGSYHAMIGIGDSGGGSATAIATLNVADAALHGYGTTISGVEGQYVNGVVGGFTDSDPNAGPSYYKATINWGDGSAPAAGWIVWNKLVNGWQIGGGHRYRYAAAYHLSIAIKDWGGSSATITSTANITDAPLSAVGRSLVVNSTTLASVPQTLATFTDGNPFAETSTFSVSINWGDGSSGLGTVQWNWKTWGFDILGRHQYAAKKRYAITITLNDRWGGGKATVQSTVTIG